MLWVLEVERNLNGVSASGVVALSIILGSSLFFA